MGSAILEDTEVATLFEVEADDEDVLMLLFWLLLLLLLLAIC